MGNIFKLIPDIQELLKTRGWFTDALMKEFNFEIGTRLQQHFNKPEGKPYLRLSQLGPKCPKALWHSIHTPELAEEMPPWVMLKYSLGHIVEGLIIGLAKAAGHEVTGEQDAISVDGVVGHRDCVIDGCVVDVKSAASRSFLKFRDKTIADVDGDPFGYLDQIDAYLLGSMDDPLVRTKDRAYLLAVDKTLGHLCLYEHKVRYDSIRKRIRDYKEIVSANQAPPCNCGTEADGESGNIKLDVKASYNSFKHLCFPSLRTFLYEGGPRHLTVVARRPMRRDNKTPIPELFR